MGINADEGVRADNRVRKRANEALKEQRLDRIYNLILLGASDENIAKTLEMSIGQYRRYVATLRNRNIKGQLSRRKEYFAHDLNICRDRLLFLMRQTLGVVNDQLATNKDKLEAIQLASSLSMTLLRVEYEGSLYLRSLDNRDPIVYNPALRRLPIHIAEGQQTTSTDTATDISDNDPNAIA